MAHSVARHLGISDEQAQEAIQAAGHRLRCVGDQPHSVSLVYGCTRGERGARLQPWETHDHLTPAASQFAHWLRHHRTVGLRCDPACPTRNKPWSTWENSVRERRTVKSIAYRGVYRLVHLRTDLHGHCGG